MAGYGVRYFVCYVVACVNSFCLCAHVGADVQIGCGQDSPLHAAVRGGGANIVDLLLDFGADGCCRNAEGKTPLDLSSPNSAVRVALQIKGVLTSHTCMLHKHPKPNFCICYKYV